MLSINRQFSAVSPFLCSVRYTYQMISTSEVYCSFFQELAIFDTYYFHSFQLKANHQLLFPNKTEDNSFSCKFDVQTSTNFWFRFTVISDIGTRYWQRNKLFELLVPCFLFMFLEVNYETQVFIDRVESQN